MLYLVTGSNGTGKTLNTLKWVRDLQLQNLHRQVFYNGRFKLKPEKESEFGWTKFEFADWQNLPDGSICIVDEAHNDLPVRPAGQKPPDHVAALAEHRSRGFDFYLISQHPSNIDNFVRRLIGSPGWHRHLRRPFGYDYVSLLEFDSVNLSCEKPGAEKNALVRRIPFPKEVYDWYDSAVIHTGKKIIPKQFFILLFGVIAVPLMLWWAVSSLSKDRSVDVSNTGAVPSNSNNSNSSDHVPTLKKTKEDYLLDHVPRIAGLAHTAPRYDEITKPVRAPVPAACLNWEERGCSCYTQQGTLMQVPTDLCLQIVDRGFFVDFQPESDVRDEKGRGVSGGLPPDVNG